MSDAEIAAITAAHGKRKLYWSRWGTWRARVLNGRCVFHVGDGCGIHDQPYYPAVGREFPWTDGETGGPSCRPWTACL